MQFQAIFYFTAHTGVIYNFVNRTQLLLQGHCNAISCSAVSEDRRWIVTADEGKDSMIVIWDSETGNPIKTIMNPHENGVKAIDMTTDAMFLVSLSCPDSNGIQQVSLWEWTRNSENPLYTMTAASVTIKSLPVTHRRTTKESKLEDDLERSVEYFQEQVCFNQDNAFEFVTTGQHHVSFWSWQNKKLECTTSEPLSAIDFGSNVGAFTQTVFLPEVAITSTTEGNLVVWEKIEDTEWEEKVSSISYRQAVKVININKSRGISFMCMHNGLLVVGGEDESVRMYDSEFRLVAWYEDLEAGAITSVSFSATSSGHKVDNPLDLSSQTNEIFPKFEIRDFVVGTSKALIVGVDAGIFDLASSDLRHGTLLLQGFETGIKAMCSHPLDTVFIAVSEHGVIQAWNFHSKRLLMVKTLHADDHPECITISATGDYVAIGCKNGMLILLRWGDVKDLGEIACFHVRRGVPYTHLAFSVNDDFLAFADAQNAVGLFKLVDVGICTSDLKVDYGKRYGDPGSGIEPSDGGDARQGWTYIGRYLSHTDSVTSIAFGMAGDGKSRLISVGEDGCVCDYDLQSSSVVDGVVLMQEPVRVEHGDSKPTCCMIHPLNKGLREELVITANSDFKLKYLNANNKTCRKTALGPLFGGALTRMMLIEQEGITGQYVAYATNDRVIGLAKLPLDGNPHKNMGLVAHPGAISDIAISPGGNSVLSAGGDDKTIHIWRVDTNVLDSAVVAASALPGLISKSLLPFVDMIQGGYDGPVYQEIIDYFYYAQLRCNGEETTSPRVTDGIVPLSEIPNLMRALGFYPSEYDIKNMCSEIRYSEFAITAKVVTTINFEQFLKLYLNHRPVNGIAQKHLQDSFDTIAGEFPGITMKQFRDLLGEHAEAIPAAELDSCLTMLMGRSEMLAMDSGKVLSADDLIADILGLQLRNEVEKCHK